MPSTARKTSSSAQAKKRPAKRRKTRLSAEVVSLIDRRNEKMRVELEAAMRAMSADLERRLGALGDIAPTVRAALEASRAPRPAISDDAFAAADELFAEALEHNEEPSSADIEAMIRSWSE